VTRSEILPALILRLEDVGELCLSPILIDREMAAETPSDPQPY